jgi:hypothetical protein
VGALRDGDLAQILSGGAIFVLMSTCPHREPLGRHHESRRGVELIVVRHLHGPLDVAETVTGSPVE